MSLDQQIYESIRKELYENGMAHINKAKKVLFEMDGKKAVVDAWITPRHILKIAMPIPGTARYRHNGQIEIGWDVYKFTKKREMQKVRRQYMTQKETLEIERYPNSENWI